MQPGEMEELLVSLETCPIQKKGLVWRLLKLYWKKLLFIALMLVLPGGLLVLCSCSATVDLGSLTRALATGAAHANAQAIVIERWFQGPDHPVPAAFGEGLYLKALIARVEPRGSAGP